MVDRTAKVSAQIERHGQNIVLSHQATPSYSEDTGWSTSESSSETIKAIPYDNVYSRILFREYGNLSVGDINFILKGEQSVADKDLIAYNNKNYVVTEVTRLPFSTNAGVAQNLGIVVVCKEQLS